VSKSKPKSIILFSSIIFLFGLMMFGYCVKYIIDGLTLENVPIASEGIAAILALITGIGLFRMHSWSFATGMVLCGFWIYGCVGGINLVVYNLVVHNKLNFESPVGAWTDAILFLVVTGFALVLIFYLWRMRNILLEK
jgi:hypothetical protein